MEWLKKILEAAGVQNVDEVIKSINTELPKHWKPNEVFNERGEKIKSLEAMLTQRDADITKLKSEVGKDSELAGKLTTLESTYQADKTKYENEIKDLKLTNAIKLAISNDAQDADLVAGLIDKSKLLLSDDGKVTGLDDQLKSIKESKSFLFKHSDSQPQQNQFQQQIYQGFNPANGAPAAGSQNAFNMQFQTIRPMPNQK